MVVKSIYVQGVTDFKGELIFKVNSNNAELRVGQWKMCLDSCIVIIPSAMDIVLSVSTSLLKTVQTNNKITTLNTGKILVTLLKGKKSEKCVVVKIGCKEWINIGQSDADEDCSLIFRNETMNAAGVELLSVFAVILLERED